MAQHIASVKGSSIPRVSRAQFWNELRTGDLIFGAGDVQVSKAIERETGSCLSHVLMAWLPPDLNQWLTMEATFEKGVHIGKMTEYVGAYPGDLILCRRPTLSADDILAVQRRFLAILDDGYNWQSEVGIAAHKLLDFLPVPEPKGDYYCSGAQYYASLAVPPGLQRPSPLWLPTPEDNFTDASVETVCALLNGAN